MSEPTTPLCRACNRVTWESTRICLPCQRILNAVGWTGLLDACEAARQQISRTSNQAGVPQQLIDAIAKAKGTT